MNASLGETEECGSEEGGGGGGGGGESEGRVRGETVVVDKGEGLAEKEGADTVETGG